MAGWRSYRSRKELVDSPRLYSELWTTLRDTGTVQFAAPPEYHKRILKGVSYEKLNDLAYKGKMLDQGRAARFEKVIEGSIVTLTLKFRVALL